MKPRPSYMDSICSYLGLAPDSDEAKAIEAVGPDHVAEVAELIEQLRGVRLAATGTSVRNSSAANWLHNAQITRHGDRDSHTPMEIVTTPELTRRWLDTLRS